MQQMSDAPSGSDQHASEVERPAPLLSSIVGLEGRREPWMDEALGNHGAMAELLERYGSPINLLDPTPLRRNLFELVESAATYDVDARIFYARKANKALCFVDEVLRAGHGVDVAGERELQQVLNRAAALDVPPDRIILTAAVKPRRLLELAARQGVTISVDNVDEWEALREVSARRAADSPPVSVALRLRVELPGRPWSRFGEAAATWRRILGETSQWSAISLTGLHFHLDGYDATERALGLDQALYLIEQARSLGHQPRFVDIGGGVPMSYLANAEPWQQFWDRHRAALESGGPNGATGDAMTWRNRPLGPVYPAWQEPVRGRWLEQVLSHPSHAAESIARRLREQDLRLHLEPGRSLLDGAGMTVTNVVQRKQWPDGTWLAGVAMNRTQCRSAADDYLVDPILVPAPDAPRVPPGEGFLVGAYCIEAELLTWRRLRFRSGLAVGDLIAWPNTAGYLMHILESASHQIPLAINLVRDPSGHWRPDRIDR